MRSMSWKIVTACDLSGVPEARQMLSDMGTLVEVGRDRARFLEELPTCDVYFGGGEQEMNDEALVRALRLQLIGSPATGRDHLALATIARRGITLFHLAEEYALLNRFTATSEGAFLLLLALIRRLPQAVHDAKEGRWAREQYTGFQLFEKTLGIIGLGRLGTIAARIGQGFGMKVVACDIVEKHVDGVTMVDMDTLLTTADVVMLHVHLTAETEHMIDARAFACMKASAVIINTSRGRLIDEDALVYALTSGAISGAGLDVIDGEWLPQEDLRAHPLITYARTHDNLVVTPHTASATYESIYGARLFMAKKLVDYMQKHEPISL
jgi:D-3-phosphoglycerate dehydrogenase / 2-oxoglutarate reductase